jgi:hypothetical protein
MDLTLPEITASSELSEAIRSACGELQSLAELERVVCANDHVDLPFLTSEVWHAFCRTILRIWQERDYVIVRGLPALGEGASLLLASIGLSGRFKTYRNGQIVKTFRMSPWTADLSHTTREGDFHTDINTDAEPPAVTAIQCLTPDPGSPQYGVNRVARAADLVRHLEEKSCEDVLRFLRETPVTMANDRGQATWTGQIIQDGRIRFHPETIRAAVRRLQIQAPEIEAHLAAIHAAALAVSTPFSLDQGDVLFVSNHRTLHYRGECSVAFIDFPLEFRARAIYVLHKMSEPQ